jgi:UDP-N-acetylmuramate--alanine ligase
MPIDGVDAEWLATGIKEHGHRHVTLYGSHDEILKNLSDMVEPGDIVMTLGAGDIDQVGDALLKALG